MPGSDFTLTGTVHTNAGTYVGDAWSFSDPSGNYASQSGTVTDSIGQANAHASVTATAGLVYNGAPQTTAAGTATDVSGAGLPGSDFTLTGTVHTNAGTYVADAWSFSDPSGNYASQSGTVTDSIGQANAHASVTATAGLVYNGSAQTTATGTATNVSGATLPGSDFTLTGTVHTNAGTYVADAWSFSDPSGNYASQSGTVTDSIGQANAHASVTAIAGLVYSGAAQTTAAGTATNVFGASLPSSDFTLTGTVHTNAGTYVGDAWSFSDPSGNYASQSGTVTDSIGQANAHASVTAIGGPDLQRRAQTTAAGTATNVFGASLPSSDFTLTGTVHTNAGTYVGDAWSFSDPSGNYASQSGTVTDSIGQANAHASVTATAGLVYNGSAQSTATGTATNVSGATLPGSDFTLTGTVHTNAGTYVADAWSFSDPSGNYASQSGTVTDSIGQANAHASVTAIAGLVYNGSARARRRARPRTSPALRCRAAISPSRARCTPTPGRTSPTPGRSPTPAATMPARAAR